MVLLKRSREHATSLAQVVEEFVSHFQELLGATMSCKELASQAAQSGPVLDIEQQLDLACDVTSEEIQKALPNIGNDKTPSPDG